MSEENVEIVRRQFELWSQGNLDEWARHWDPDVIVVAPEGWPEGETYRGLDAWRRQAERLRDSWEEARAETARLAWRPYMYNPSLGPLLEGARGLPTLVLWGRQDQIVPLSAGQIYHRSITGAELAIFEGCGHRPEIEHAQGFIERVHHFLT